MKVELIIYCRSNQDELCYYGTSELPDGYSLGGKREIAKLMINSLYAKFGTNPMRDCKKPKCDKCFCYCDTDSVHDASIDGKPASFT